MGAVLLSFGTAVQQRGVAEVDASDEHERRGGLGLRQLVVLVRTGRWLLGTGMVVLAIACQLGALAFAPIAVVQPVGILALVVTAGITAHRSHQRLGAASIGAIAMCVLALTAFVVVASLTTRTAPIHDGEVIAVLIIVASGFAVLLVGYVVFRRRFSRVFYVIAAGVLLGLVATLAKVIFGRVETVVGHHGSPFAVGVPTYVCLLGIILAGSLGQYFQQTAYRSGSPEVVVAGLTVIDPIVGATVGMTTLAEAAQAPGWAFAVFGVAGAVAIAGVVLLSRGRPHQTAESARDS